MQATFYRDTSNLLILQGLVDWNDRDAAGAPTPVITGVTVTGRVFAPDRVTPLSSAVALVQEADQPQNYYRGVVPRISEEALFGYDYVSIQFVVDGGATTAYAERWLDAKVVDE